MQTRSLLCLSLFFCLPRGHLGFNESWTRILSPLANSDQISTHHGLFKASWWWHCGRGCSVFELLVSYKTTVTTSCRSGRVSFASMS